MKIIYLFFFMILIFVSGCREPNFVAPQANEDLNETTISNNLVFDCTAKKRNWVNSYSLSPNGKALLFTHPSSSVPPRHNQDIYQRGEPYKINLLKVNWGRHEKPISLISSYWSRSIVSMGRSEVLTYWTSENHFAFTDSDDVPTVGRASVVNASTGKRTTIPFGYLWRYGYFPENPARSGDSYTDISRNFGALHDDWLPNNYGLPVYHESIDVNGLTVSVAIDFEFPEYEQSVFPLYGKPINWQEQQENEIDLPENQNSVVTPVKFKLAENLNVENFEFRALPFGRYFEETSIDVNNKEYAEKITHLFFLTNSDDEFVSLYKFNAVDKIISRIFTSHDSDIQNVAFSRNGEKIYWVRTETGLPEYFPVAENGKNILKFLNVGDQERVNIVSSDTTGSKHLVIRDSFSTGAQLLLIDTLGKETIVVDECELNEFMPWGVGEVFSFEASDGVGVHGNIYRPEQNPNGITIFYLHGGPTYKERFTWENLYFKSLIDRGYTVVVPNFRGSTGYGKKYRDEGRKKFDRARKDILETVDFILENKGINEKKMALMGNSFGGYLAASIATNETHKFSAIVSRNGIYDLVNFLETPIKRLNGTTLNYSRTSAVFGNLDDSAQYQYLVENSPTNNFEALNVPILIIHALEDEKIPHTQSEAFYRLLTSNGCEVECVFERIEGNHQIDNLITLDFYISKVDIFLQNNLQISQ